MPHKKGKKVDELEGDEGCYVSVRDFPFDLLRLRASATNLGLAERREARRELLLKMGAKPPKGTAMNYRLLMEARKRERQNALTEYKNERFKRTTLERHLGKGRNKWRRRKALRHIKGKKAGKSSATTHISKSLAKRIRRKK
ncbi:hypothetical protein TcWFU_008612 [Taenia crassiceps]|uniref:Uncharacterized protein n=1 Tax=Taenia crassiceps TaxID=6207 RepID=A0ABR4Q3Q3_9CEST